MSFFFQHKLRHITRFCTLHPKKIIFIWLLFGLLGIFSYFSLPWDTSHEVWFIPDDPIIQNYQEMQRTFGDNEKLLIGLHHPELLHTVDHVAFLQNFTKSLLKIKNVEKVENLATAFYISRDDTGNVLTVEKILPPAQELDAKKLSEILPQLQRHTHALSPAFNKEKTMTLTVLSLSTTENPIQTASEVVRDIKKLFLHTKLPNMEILLSGTPALSARFYELSRTELKTHLTGLLIVTILLLSFFLRSIAGVLGPLLVLIVSNGSVGFAAFLMNMKINNVTAILPVILTGIAVTEMVHLTSHFSRLRKTHNTSEALDQTMSILIFPSSISLITTIDGFLGLLTCSLLPLIQLGLLASIGVFFALLSTFTLGPALITIFPPQVPILEKFFNKTPKETDKSFRFFSSRLTTIIFLIVSLTCFWGFKKPFQSSTYLDYFGPHEKIRTDTIALEKAFGGVVPLEWIIEPHDKNNPLSPETLKNLAELERLLKQEEKIYSTQSLIAIISQTDMIVTGKARAPHKIPEDVLKKYLALYNTFSPDIPLNHWYDAETSKLRVTTLVKMMDSQDFSELITRVQNRIERRIPELNAHPTGVGALFAVMEDHLKSSLTNSILFSSALILLFLIFVLRSLKFTVLAALTNGLPLITIYGLMRLQEVPLDAGVAMLFAVSLGIIVDDTTHYLHHLRLARKNGEDFPSALRHVFSLTGAPLSVTTLVLACSFIVAAFSNFMPNQHFGIYGSLTLLFAALTDLILIPGLLLFFSPRKPKMDNAPSDNL